MNKQIEQFEIEFYYITRTEKALCVSEDLDEGEEVWLPLFDKYGNEIVTFERNGLKVTVWAPENLLTEKGLV